MSDNVSIVSVQEAFDHKLIHQSTSLKPSDNEYFPTGSEVYVKSDITVVERILENRCQVERKQSWNQNVSLFAAIFDLYCTEKLTIVADTSFHGTV